MATPKQLIDEVVDTVFHALKMSQDMAEDASRGMGDDEANLLGADQVETLKREAGMKMMLVECGFSANEIRLTYAGAEYFICVKRAGDD
jgi:hypothetical protein